MIRILLFSTRVCSVLFGVVVYSIYQNITDIHLTV